MKTDSRRQPGKVAPSPPVAATLPPSSPGELARALDVLAGLGLDAKDLAVLRRQGSVQPERRGRRIVWKLHFRQEGRQVVRYLGGGERAAAAALALARLQARHRAARQLARLAREAAPVLRRSKQQLEPTLAAAGYRFHGLAVRKRRRRNRNTTANSEKRPPAIDSDETVVGPERVNKPLRTLQGDLP